MIVSKQRIIAEWNNIYALYSENAKRIEAVAVVLGIDTSLVAETISEMEIEK